MRKLALVARGTVSLIAGLTVLAVLAYAGLLVAGFRPVAVYSGSMLPTLAVGALAVDRPVPSTAVRVGDVITFSDPYLPGRMVTHRVLRIFQRPTGRVYWTKGDANPARDPWAIKLSGSVGRVAFDVPYVGYALVYARTRELRTALILLASLSLLVPLLRRIWRTPEQTVRAA
jgi:signal peptidase I